MELLDQIFDQCSGGKPVWVSRSTPWPESLGDLRRDLRQLGDDQAQLGGGALAVGLGEDGPDQRGDDLALIVAGHRQQVACRMHPAALSAGTLQDLADRGP